MISKKQQLNAKAILEHQQQTWQEYASVSIAILDRPGYTARLTLAYNGIGNYRVQHGTTLLYDGDDLELAIAAWDEA